MGAGVFRLENQSILDSDLKWNIYYWIERNKEELNNILNETILSTWFLSKEFMKDKFNFLMLVVNGKI